ncbi:putative TOS1-like glycosyl hydrolase-domain-containing protein [Leptodontidium sp. MPI-SDFR-AT-0119]|nr:putative TOS1-like glycosyl hydrolase-domain-containing protein [Leptodontidium sp. MPI-SDFR-AT-0119]
MDGNYYCQAIKAVRYQNVGHAGSYDEIVSMSGDGSCGTKTKKFSGRLAPFDEELSLHIRGPAMIKQVAVYLPGSHGDKVDKRTHGHQHSHIKALYNIHYKDIAKKDKVVATIDGQVVSWENNWFGPSADSTLTTLATETLKKPFGAVQTPVTTVLTTEFSTTCITSQPVGASVSNSNDKPTSGMVLCSVPTSMPTPSIADNLADNKDNSKPKHSYKRIGYYEASSQTVENLVFLGNFGGQGSGVFDYHYGASLAYANRNGTAGSPTSQILADTLIPSRNEVIITTDKKCNNNDCGFTRPGAVTYHGFDGADKVFFIEVGMPSDGQTGAEGDQPAAWMLNTKIPRTMQYGKCSCWPGCGELDIAEALSVGSRYMKSTVHAQASGGDSDYFNRPLQGTATIMTIFSKDEIFIGIVPNMKFPDKLTSHDLDALMDEDATSVSDFTIA